MEICPAGAPWQPPAGANLPVLGYTVVRTYPHDRDAFTQGLQFLDGFLYEGTGLNGRSSIRKVKLETGEVVQRRDVPAQYFGEGIVVWQSELFELTWQSGVAFIYDRATFAPRRSVKYQGEGWGLTHDGASLIMSDGSDSLRFLDPATFDERRRLKVTAAGVPLCALNEREYVKGEIFGNVWQTDYIARIDPKTGRVTGWVDLQGLLPARPRFDRRPQRHRVRRGRRSPVHHGEALAAPVRDHVDGAGQVDVSLTCSKITPDSPPVPRCLTITAPLSGFGYIGVSGSPPGRGDVVRYTS
jgi:glutamine cyclotransferase